MNREFAHTDVPRAMVERSKIKRQPLSAFSKPRYNIIRVFGKASIYTSVIHFAMSTSETTYIQVYCYICYVFRRVYIHKL